jgi:hypothetical protein
LVSGARMGWATAMGLQKKPWNIGNLNSRGGTSYVYVHMFTHIYISANICLYIFFHLTAQRSWIPLRQLAGSNSGLCRSPHLLTKSAPIYIYIHICIYRYMCIYICMYIFMYYVYIYI